MVFSRSRLFLAWLVISITLFVLMLGHTSTPATILGRFSPSYVVTLGVMVATILVAAGGYGLAKANRLPALSLRLPGTRWTAWGITLGGATMIVLLWLFLPGSLHLPALAAFRVYVVALVFAGLWALLHLSGTFDLPLADRWMVMIPAGVIVLMVVLTVLYLGRTQPSTLQDEPFLVNWAWSSFRSGEPSLSMFPSRQREFQAFGSALVPVMGAWLNVVGISLKSARLFWLLVGWAGAPFIYLTARRLYGKVAALVALVFALVIPLEHSEVRPDIWVSTILAIALYCFFRARATQSRILHFGVGLALGLAAEGNQYSVRFALAFLLIYVIDYIQLIRKTRRWVWNPPFWAFAAGGLTFIVGYVVLHVVVWARVDLPGALAILRQLYNTETELMSAMSYWERILKSSLEWFVNYPGAHPFETLLALAGIGGALLRWRESDRILLFILLVGTVLLCLLLAHYQPFYWIHHLPIIALLGGAFAGDLVRRSGVEQLNFAVVALIAGGVALLAANIHYVATRSPNADRYIQIGEIIGQSLPPEIEWVTGDQIFYYGLSERHYVSIGELETRPTTVWKSELGVEAPQAVILIEGLFGDFPAMKSYIRSSGLELAQCFDVEAARGTRVELYLPTSSLLADAPPGCKSALHPG